MNEKLKIIISAEVDKLKKGMEEAKSKVNSFKEQVAKASKDVDDKISSLGSSMSSGIKAGVTAIAAAGTALVALGASTAEYRAEQAKLVSAFETAGASAETAKATYNDLYRVLGDGGTAVEAAQQLANITTEEEKLAEYTNICQGIYAKWGSAIDSAGLAEGINHTIELGSVQGTLADALEWSGVSVDDFNAKLEACNTEAEEEALVRETLSGMYSEAAAQYEENAAGLIAQNEAQAKLQETLGTLGEAVAPVVAAFTNFANDALAVVVPYIKDFAEAHAPKLQTALDAMANIVQAIFSAITENWGLVLTIAGVIGGITAAITLYNVVAAIKAAMAAAEVTTVWGLVAAYTAQAVAMGAALAPYILIVAAIAAVIAIIVLCIKHWDDIKEAAKKAWEFIKDAWAKAADWMNEKVIQPIVNFFTGLWNKVKEVFGKVKEWLSNAFSQAWEGIKNAFSGTIIGDYFKMVWENIKLVFSVVKDVFSGNFKDAWESVKKIFSNVGSFFSGVWDKIKNTFSALGSKLGDAIGGAVKSGINKVIGWIESTINKAIGLINGAIGLINKIPGVSVPTLNKLTLPRLAKGGIIDTATIAMIGEQGKEAVVPLENNLEWLDKLAAMLGDRMGGNTPIVLTVDGKVLAQTTTESINKLTKQTGKLGLVLA